MNHVTPLELIQERHSDYEMSLQKLFESRQANKVSQEDYNIRKENLRKKIFSYQQAIDLLKNMGI